MPRAKRGEFGRRQLFGLAAAGVAAAGLGGLPAPVIDSHVHLWKIDPRHPFIKQPNVVPPDRDATAEMLLALMKAHGVQKSVLVQVSHHGWDHSYLGETLRRYPRDFIAVARVNPEDPAAPDQLSHLCQEQGFAGLRLNVQPDPAFDWVRGPLVLPLLRRCQALRIPLCLQTKGPRLAELLPLCERVPELTVIVDHMADVPLDDPGAAQALLAFARLPRAHVKISHTWWISKQPYPYADAQVLAKRVYDRFGPRRLLFGTDWPIVERFCGYAKALAMVQTEMKFLSADDRRCVLGQNAARIWLGRG
jgi:L-fuconolactonase